MHQAVRELLRRPVAYQPIVAKAFGDVKLAILWCQLFYWSDKTNDPEGWIYKSRDELYDETGLSRREQEHARKVGWELKVLESKRVRFPASVHMRIDQDRAGELIEKYLSDHPAEGKKIGVQVSPGLFGNDVILSGEGKRVIQKPIYATIGYVRKMPPEDVKELADYFFVTEKFVLDRAQDVVDYCEAKHKSYSNYKAALRNFIKSHMERRPGEAKMMREKIEDKKREQIRRLEDEKNADVSPEEADRRAKAIEKIKADIRNKFVFKKS